MLIRSKKTGKVYEVIGDDKVPEGFEEVSKAGGKTEQKEKVPSRAGFGKNTPHRKSRGEKSGKTATKSTRIIQSKISFVGDKIVEKEIGEVEVEDLGTKRNKEKKNGRA